MDANINITALKHTGQAIGLHVGSFMIEIAGIVVVLIVFALSAQGAMVQVDRTLTVAYIMWSLRAIQIVAQVLIVVFLTQLIPVREDFADARLIYVVLVVATALSFVLDGMADGRDAVALSEGVSENLGTVALFACLAVMDMVAKPVLLALGNRTTLFACASVLDSFGLYELAKKNRRVGVRFSVACLLFAGIGITALVALVLLSRGGMLLPDYLDSGVFYAGGVMVGFDILLALAACAFLACLVLWGLSARCVGRTYDALRELSL